MLVPKSAQNAFFPKPNLAQELHLACIEHVLKSNFINTKQAIFRNQADFSHSLSFLARAKRLTELSYLTPVSFSIMMVTSMSLTKTRKVGGSLVVTLPKELVESKKIKEGEIVEIIVKKIRKDGFGVFKSLTPFAAKDELTAHE